MICPYKSEEPMPKLWSYPVCLSTFAKTNGWMDQKCIITFPQFTRILLGDQLELILRKTDLQKLNIGYYDKKDLLTKQTQFCQAKRVTMICESISKVFEKVDTVRAVRSLNKTLVKYSSNRKKRNVKSPTNLRLAYSSPLARQE